MAKRVHSKPFTDEECKVFVDIVKKYKHIVENKETDGATTATKNKAWEDLGKEFNAQGISHFRSTPTLRTKWKALKKDARKENAEYRRYANGTGGGPPAKPVSTLYDKVLDVVDRKSIEGCKGSPDMEYEFLHPNAPATPTIGHSLALYNGNEPSTSTSVPQHQYMMDDSIDNHILEEEMEDDPIPTMLDGVIQPSSDALDKTTSTIWNRSGYTSGMFSKPRSKLLRTSRSSVGKFPLQYVVVIVLLTLLSVSVLLEYE
uniref:Regulatory protein zeste n=1 Tax=Cacopsylla melanoneura TaxID=428564 RepID=A0A8D8STD1_9HEMI